MNEPPNNTEGMTDTPGSANAERQANVSGPKPAPASPQSAEQNDLAHREITELRSRLARMEELVTGVDAKLAELGAQFSKRLAYDAAKDEMIRNLSDEVSRYRDDWFRRQLKPLVMDCIRLFDTLEGVRASVLAQQPPSDQEVVQELEIVRGELLELLARQDVTPYELHPERLDPRLHRTINTEPATSLEDDNLVSTVVWAGFMWGSQVLRPEGVVVKKFEPVTEKG